MVDVEVGGPFEGEAVVLGEPLAGADVAAGGLADAFEGFGDEDFGAGVAAVAVLVVPVGELGPVVVRRSSPGRSSAGGAGAGR